MFYLIKNLYAIQSETEIFLNNTSQYNLYSTNKYNINNSSNFFLWSNKSGLLINNTLSDLPSIFSLGSLLFRFYINYDFQYFQEYENNSTYKGDTDAKILVMHYQDNWKNMNVAIGKQILSFSVSESLQPLDITHRNKTPNLDLTNYILEEEGMIGGVIGYSINNNTSVIVGYFDDSLEYDYSKYNSNNSLRTNYGVKQSFVKLGHYAEQLKGVNVSVILKYQDIEKLGIGGSISSNISNNIQIHSEFFTSQYSSVGLWDSNSNSYVISNKKSYNTQGVIGATITPEYINGLSITLEYLYNGFGVSYSTYQDNIKDINNKALFLPTNQSNLIMNSFSQGYQNVLTLIHYGFLRLNYIYDKYELSNSTYLSIEDYSILNDLYVSMNITNNIKFKLGSTFFVGNSYTSFVDNPLNANIYLIFQYKIT